MAITAPWRNADDIITVKDLSDTDYPSYEALRSKHFPLSAADYSVLMSLPPRDQDDGPVIMVQIDFIKGGMVWGIIFDHAYTDGTGAAFIPKVWAAYCRGEDGSKFVTPDLISRDRLMHGSKTGRSEDYPLFQYGSEAEVAKAKVPEGVSSVTNPLSRVLQTLRSGLSRFRSASSIMLQALNKSGAETSLRNEISVSNAQDDIVVGEVFFFPKEKLSELKKAASTQAHWISTNDALASLIYCCITDTNKAKNRPNNHARIKDPTTETSRTQWLGKAAVLGSHETEEPFAVLGFPTNARKHFEPPLPPNYIGNVTIWNGIAAPLSTVASSLQSVSTFANHLRSRIQTCDPVYVSGLIGVLDSVPDIGSVGLSPGPYPEFLVVVNSWAGFKWLDIDWGSVVGGKCERLRFEIVKVPGFCHVLPEIGVGSRCEGGEGLEVVVTLTQGSLNLLKKNELFMSFAQCRCD